ncbi:MAG: hypothetical protein ACREEM_06960 [Blastocatellia bacterium]
MPTFNQTMEKIRVFANLDNGWHYDSGKGMSEFSVSAGIKILVYAHAMGFTSMDVFPGLSGEVQVTLYDEDSYYEFTVELDRSLTIVHEIGKEEVLYLENQSLNKAIEKIEDLAFGYGEPPFLEEVEDAIKQPWGLSESLTRFTTTLPEESSKVWLSKMGMTIKSPSSMASAPWTPADPFAITSTGFTWS